MKNMCTHVEITAYGDFWDNARGIPLSTGWSGECPLSGSEVALELERVMQLSDERKKAYELAVTEGDAEGFWEALRQLPADHSAPRSTYATSCPILISALRQESCLVQMGSVKFSFFQGDEMLESAVKGSLKWMSLAALSISGKRLVPEGDHAAPCFKPLGVECRQRLASDLQRAAFFEWPVKGPYNTKWRRIANWLNGYVLHLCRTVWSWEKRMLEPRFLYIGRNKALSMKMWDKDTQDIVRAVIPSSWKRKKKKKTNALEYYPEQPAFVLWCHADPIGKPGLFSKVKEIVSCLLKEYASVFNPQIADFSGVFWELKDFSMNWNLVTVLNLTDNQISNADLKTVERLVKLCPNLRKIRLMAGNEVTLQEARSLFSGLKIY